jgi:type IV secretion system protein VirD4
MRRLLIALAILATVAFAGGFFAGTQYCASAFRYHAVLGRPVATVSGTAIYAPWAWLGWAKRFGDRAPRTFAVAEALSFGGGLIGFVVLLVALVRVRGARESTAHGSARWAMRRELAEAGLLDDAGIVLCQTADARLTSSSDGRGGRIWKLARQGALIRHAGPEHVLVFAPTRSGKGVGTVVPTLLTWPASVVVYDIKKELWELTGGWRRRFSHCWRFEPTGAGGIRFNPLFEVRKGSGEVRDAQNIAEILIDPEGRGEKDHWRLSGASLLTGVILHVLYAERDKSLSGVSAFLSDPLRTQFDILSRMLTTSHLPDGPHPVVAQTARAMLNKSENELSGVVSTAKAALTLYEDPIVADNTSRSDFRIADLMNADHPVSLYLVVPPSDLERTRPLVRLLLNQMGKRLTEKMSVKGPGYAHRLLMLLDEFPTLGRLSFFEGALAFSAGYGIKCFLICQSLNQLEKAYGRDNSIIDNCHVRMAYAANRAETAKTISELMGQSTASKRQRSFSGKGLLGAKSVSESDQEFARPLMTPDEVLRLPYEDALVFVGGLPPYRGRKAMYYLDSRLASRAGLPPPESARAQRRELLPGVGSEWATLGSVAAPPRPAPPDDLPIPAGGFVPSVPAVQPGGAQDTASAPPTSLAAAWQELLGEAPPASEDPPDTEAPPAESSEEPPAAKPPGGLPL